MSEHTDNCPTCARYRPAWKEQNRPTPAPAGTVSAHDHAIDHLNTNRWRRRPTVKPMVDRAVDLIAQRKQLGLERYGTVLHPDDGRDHYRDLIEELADAYAYAAALHAADRLQSDYLDDIANLLVETLHEHSLWENQ